jgi:hypothetical protein
MGRGFSRGAAAATAVCIGLLIAAASAPAFDIDAYSSAYVDPSGAPLTLAGSHADLVTELDFDASDGSQVRDIEIEMPAGFFGNPRAVPRCSMAELSTGEGYCNPAAQVGLLHYEYATGEFLDFPVYNLLAADQQAAVLGVVVGAPAKIVISPRTDGDYGLTASIRNINQGISLAKIRLMLWGVPASPVHDPDRLTKLEKGGASAGIAEVPLLSTPTRCEPLTTAVRADSWQHPGVWVSSSAPTPALTGCDELEFSPRLQARPTTDAADSPTGLDLDLTIPQNQDPEGRAAAHLRKAELVLPEGLAINPSGANGLGACSPQQIGLASAIGSGSARFTRTAPDCPDSSRIGSVAIDTPAFADPLEGGIFLATPEQNPFGNLLTAYAVVAGHGMIVKLAGEVTPDPLTGRVAIRFDETPQLPFEAFELSFFSGASAPLRTPSVCGTYASSPTLTPWSAPQSGPPATPTDTYAIGHGAKGAGCVYSQPALPNVPSFEAGSTAPLAGAYRPFVVNLRRADGTQRLSSIAFSPPPGLVAKLAGSSTCSDVALLTAATRSGGEEKFDSACPATSAVGSVAISAGAGPAPYNLLGKIYLAGPYKGAPLSLAIVTPALAGPVDLGTTVVRAALHVDPTTAQISAVSDPLPTILAGIPLDLRSVSIRLDRPEFTRNPTSCDPMTVQGTVGSAQGNATGVSARFQLAECGRLAFKPRLSLKLVGPVHRSAHPSLRATLTMPAGGANLARLALTLPRAALLEGSHIRSVCTRLRFDAGTCPPSSVYGHAAAVSPLLAQPLRGSVYLRENPTRLLPDLVASLDGQIHLDIVGRIDSPRGRIRASFDTPDVPLRRFSVALRSGGHGLIVNTGGLCGSRRVRAGAEFVAQNGVSRLGSPQLRTECPARRSGAR